MLKRVRTKIWLTWWLIHCEQWYFPDTLICSLAFLPCFKKPKQQQKTHHSIAQQAIPSINHVLCESISAFLFLCNLLIKFLATVPVWIVIHYPCQSCKYFSLPLGFLCPMLKSPSLLTYHIHENSCRMWCSCRIFSHPLSKLFFIHFGWEQRKDQLLCS